MSFTAFLCAIAGKIAIALEIAVQNVINLTRSINLSLNNNNKYIAPNKTGLIITVGYILIALTSGNDLNHLTIAFNPNIKTTIRVIIAIDLNLENSPASVVPVSNRPYNCIIIPAGTPMLKPKYTT
jgi:hypothetical protein